ncbi:hypothetical protein LLH00_01805 [bacterium]|nr:hypothetical protein [bacterium]
MSTNVKLIYSYEQILAGVDALAQKIHQGLIGPDGTAEAVTFLVLLKGGVRFACDLMARYPGRYYYDFAGVSSYSDNTYSRGVVEFSHFAPRRDLLDGRVVVLLDDICDSGLTLGSVAGRLEREFQPAAIRTCVLLHRQGAAFTPDSCVFQVSGEDYFVGYGLGMGEEYRHLNGIYAVTVG